MVIRQSMLARQGISLDRVTFGSKVLESAPMNLKRLALTVIVFLLCQQAGALFAAVNHAAVNMRETVIEFGNDHDMASHADHRALMEPEGHTAHSSMDAAECCNFECECCVGHCHSSLATESFLVAFFSLSSSLYPLSRVTSRAHTESLPPTDFCLTQDQSVCAKR